MRAVYGKAGGFSVGVAMYDVIQCLCLLLTLRMLVWKGHCLAMCSLYLFDMTQCICLVLSAAYLEMPIPYMYVPAFFAVKTLPSHCASPDAWRRHYLCV